MKPTVTLACIAGNAEKYIDRFLDSFQPHFDEVIIVRAIGNQEPDKTLEIAEKRGCRTGEYKNKITREPDLEVEGFDKVEVTSHYDWPHVDDFAAARNVAFDMATCDWVMWADLDDTLEGGENIKSDLEAMPADAVALSVPYDVRDDQLVVMRERVIRKGAARWINPVHEQLDFKDGVQVCETDRWKLVHQPKGKRTANDQRNVRILESIENPTGSQRFHLMQSLRAVGRVDESIECGQKILLEQPEDVGTAELYEVCFFLAQLTNDANQRAQLMFQALMIDPTRREAYGDLAVSYIVGDKPKEARALILAMKALPLPTPPPWNIRRKYYEYMEPLLEGMTLRRLGDIKGADVLEKNAFIRAGAKISLLHATRGRPQQAAECRRKWLERAANPAAIEHIFAFDVDDDSAGLLTLHRHVWCQPGLGPVGGWNTAARVSAGQVLLQLSDDWEPPLHWDAMILDAMGPLDAPKVLAVSDGHRTDDLLCMAILTRSRYNQQGYLFHPEFFSMYSDNWFSKQSFESGCLIDARDKIVFEHLHPCFGKAETDATYERSNAPYNYTAGQGVYDRLCKGVKVSAEMDGWFDFRDVYDFLAQMLPADGKMVEVGCYKGKSICYLYDRLQDVGKGGVEVTVVDSFKGDPEAGFSDFHDEYLANVADRNIKAITGDSAASSNEFTNGSLDAVFIDAAHDYHSALADIASWRPKVKAGGFLCGHDIDAPGVQKALKELGIKFGKVGRCWVQLPEQN